MIEDMDRKMVQVKTWDEFREAGMLWWINVILHTFGWAIAVELNENGKVASAFPTRVKYRGFDEETNTEGYKKVSGFLAKTALQLKKEADE